MSRSGSSADACKWLRRGDVDFYHLLLPDKQTLDRDNDVDLAAREQLVWLRVPTFLRPEGPVCQWR